LAEKLLKHTFLFVWRKTEGEKQSARYVYHIETGACAKVIWFSSFIQLWSIPQT